MRNIRLILACLSVILLSSGLASAQTGAARFDRFNDVNCEDEMARLDNFAVQLKSIPASTGYIIVYGGRNGRRGEARARASRIRSYVVKSRGLDPYIVKTVDGGYMDQLTVDLWIAAPGADEPVPAPTVRPQDVRFKKGRIKRSEYERCGP
jgi:hypothetical protein